MATTIASSALPVPVAGCQSEQQVNKTQQYNNNSNSNNFSVITDSSSRSSLENEHDEPGGSSLQRAQAGSSLEPLNQDHNHDQQQTNSMNNDSNGIMTTSKIYLEYDVEHLATFSLCLTADSTMKPKLNDVTTSEIRNKGQIVTSVNGGDAESSVDCDFSSNNNEQQTQNINANNWKRKQQVRTNIKQQGKTRPSTGRHSSAADPPDSDLHQDRDQDNAKLNVHRNNANYQEHDQPASRATSTDDALERLFALEKLSGIWTQHMKLQLGGGNDHDNDQGLKIIDCETGNQLESFHWSQLEHLEAHRQFNDIYNNILLFIIRRPTEDTNLQSSELTNHLPLGSDNHSTLINTAAHNYTTLTDLGSPREIHIFQCISHEAQVILRQMKAWKEQQQQKQLQQSKMNEISTSDVDRQSNENPINNTADEQQPEVSNSHSNLDKIQQPMNNDNKSEQAKLIKNPAKPMIKVASSKPEPMSSRPADGQEPLINVNVKETVQVFNQIAAQRDKSSPVAGQAPTAVTSGHKKLGATDSLGPSEPSANSKEAANKQAPVRANLSHFKQQHHGSSPTVAVAGHRVSLHSNGSSSSACSSSSTGGDPPSKSLNSSSSKSHHHPTTKVGHRHHPSSTSNPMKSAASSSASSSAETNQITSRSKSSLVHKQQSLDVKMTTQQEQSTARDKHKRSSSQVRTSPSEQVTTNESYVSVLNHCFDDIEKFILRLQQSASAHRELQVAKRRLSRRATSQSRHLSTDNSSMGLKSSQNVGNGGRIASQDTPLSSNELALLSMKAHGPSEEDYFEILSKFKLAFNLLAKLKGCIHDPNAPELVHFLFTPLTIIIDSARNAPVPVDPTLVGIPYLNQDALDLLSNCCTSKESDMWLSLGPNWTQTIDPNLLKISRLPSSFQPVFSDGWAPVIGELELIGLIMQPATSNQQQAASSRKSLDKSSSSSSGARPVGSPTPAPGVDCGSSKAKTQALKSNDNHRSHYQSQHFLEAQLQHNKQAAPPSARRNAHAIDAPYLAKTDNFYPGPEPLDPTYRSGHHYSSRGIGEQKPGAITRSSRASRYPNNGDPNGPIGEIANGIRDLHPANERLHYLSTSTTTGNETNCDYEPDYSTGLELATRVSGNRGPSSAGKATKQPLYQQPGSAYARAADYHDVAPTNLMEPMYPGFESSPDGAGRYSRHYARQSGDVLLTPAYLARRYTQNPSTSHHVTSRHQSSGAAEPSPSDFDESTKLELPLAGYLDEADQEAMLMDLGPAQTEWFFELQSRGALIVRVLFTREANNDKELSVRRGELLEIMDNSRRWWRARNIDLEIAFVPHTIVAVMQGYQSLDELLITTNGELEHPGLMMDRAEQQQQPIPSGRNQNSRAGANHYSRHQMNPNPRIQQQTGRTKPTDPFRYF